MPNQALEPHKIHYRHGDACRKPKRGAKRFRIEQWKPKRRAGIMVRLSSYRKRAIVETVKLSSKGQVVIPKAIRDACHLHTGEEFIITTVGGEIRLRPTASAIKRTTLDEVAGMLHRPGVKAPSNDETDRRIGAMLKAEDEATKTKRKRA